MSFKDNLRKQRLKACLSQEKLAFSMSVSRQTISKWENGDTYPSTEHILMLVKILECSADDLIENEVAFKQPEPEDTQIQVSQREKHLVWTIGVTLALVLVFLLVFSLVGGKSYERMNELKIATFNSVMSSTFEKAIHADGHAKKKIVGYGIEGESQRFYIKCELENNGQNGPCMAIVYFCENYGSFTYECQYLEDPDYLPAGEYYKIS